MSAHGALTQTCTMHYMEVCLERGASWTISRHRHSTQLSVTVPLNYSAMQKSPIAQVSPVFSTRTTVGPARMIRIWLMCRCCCLACDCGCFEWPACSCNPTSGVSFCCFEVCCILMAAECLYHVVIKCSSGSHGSGSDCCHFTSNHPPSSSLCLPASAVVSSDTSVLTLRTVSVHRPQHPRSHCQRNVHKSVPNITVQHATSSTVHSPGPRTKDPGVEMLSHKASEPKKSHTMVMWMVSISALHLLSLHRTSYYRYAIIGMEVSCGDAPVTTTLNLLWKSVTQ